MSLLYRNKLVRIQFLLKYHFDLHKHKNDMHAHIKLDLIDTKKICLKEMYFALFIHTEAMVRKYCKHLILTF